MDCTERKDVPGCGEVNHHEFRLGGLQHGVVFVHGGNVLHDFLYFGFLILVRSKGGLSCVIFILESSAMFGVRTAQARSPAGSQDPKYEGGTNAARPAAAGSTKNSTGPCAGPTRPRPCLCARATTNMRQKYETKQATKQGDKTGDKTGGQIREK